MPGLVAAYTFVRRAEGETVGLVVCELDGAERLGGELHAPVKRAIATIAANSSRRGVTLRIRIRSSMTRGVHAFGIRLQINH
jgi:hypothetical protein